MKKVVRLFYLIVVVSMVIGMMQMPVIHADATDTSVFYTKCSTRANALGIAPWNISWQLPNGYTSTLTAESIFGQSGPQKSDANPCARINYIGSKWGDDSWVTTMNAAYTPYLLLNSKSNVEKLENHKYVTYRFDVLFGNANSSVIVMLKDKENKVANAYYATVRASNSAPAIDSAYKSREISYTVGDVNKWHRVVVTLPIVEGENGDFKLYVDNMTSPVGTMNITSTGFGANSGFMIKASPGVEVDTYLDNIYHYAGDFVAHEDEYLSLESGELIKVDGDTITVPENTDASGFVGAVTDETNVFLYNSDLTAKVTSGVITGDMIFVLGSKNGLYKYYNITVDGAPVPVKPGNVDIGFCAPERAFTFVADKATGAGIYIAAYKDRRLTDIFSQTCTLSDASNSFDISKVSTDGCDTIRAFAFSSDGKLTPLSNSLSMPVKALDTLYVKNGCITNSKGEEVVLKGVNFGGWLIQETWMCPVLPCGTMTSNGKTVDWAHLDTLNMLEEKLGVEDAGKIMQQYYDNYITEQDFKNVADLGLNCVRIPFWYRNFMSDENGTYITKNDDDNPGFKKFDWIIQMANKYKLYIIFDMHGCPGGQNGDHSSGKTGRNYLYYESKYQDIMEDLWVKIADRYKYEPCIAAYDIMNEPLNNADANHGVKEAYRASAWNDSTKSLVNDVYIRMVNAIRKVDKLHPITVEGIWRLDRLPSQSKIKSLGWDKQNIIYQLHIYDSDQPTVSSLADSLKNAKNNNYVGAFVGEFNPNVYYGDSISEFNNRKVSYTVWNYKTECFSGTPTTWGVYFRDLSFNMSAMLNEAGLTESEKNIVYTGNLSGLSASAIKKFYSTAWTSKYLSTSNGFNANYILKSVLK